MFRRWSAVEGIDCGGSFRKSYNLCNHNFGIGGEVVAVQAVQDGREPRHLVVDVVAGDDVTDVWRVSRSADGKNV